MTTLIPRTLKINMSKNSFNFSQNISDCSISKKPCKCRGLEILVIFNGVLVIPITCPKFSCKNMKIHTVLHSIYDAKINVKTHYYLILQTFIAYKITQTTITILLFIFQAQKYKILHKM